MKSGNCVRALYYTISKFNTIFMAHAVYFLSSSPYYKWEGMYKDYQLEQPKWVLLYSLGVFMRRAGPKHIQAQINFRAGPGRAEVFQTLACPFSQSSWAGLFH